MKYLLLLSLLLCWSCVSSENETTETVLNGGKCINVYSRGLQYIITSTHISGNCGPVQPFTAPVPSGYFNESMEFVQGYHPQQVNAHYSKKDCKNEDSVSLTYEDCSIYRSINCQFQDEYTAEGMTFVQIEDQYHWYGDGATGLLKYTTDHCSSTYEVEVRLYANQAPIGVLFPIELP